MDRGTSAREQEEATASEISQKNSGSKVEHGVLSTK